MVQVRLVHEPAAGDGCYRSRIEDGEFDRILRLDGATWDELDRPGAVIVTIEAAQVDGP